MTRTIAATVASIFAATLAYAQITAQLPPGPTAPAWTKGIQPISQESYWNAVECGKQRGNRPNCVFYDADFCKNPDFAITFFTPYKMVAYEVWQTVRGGQPPPTPDYGAAQRTRVTVGIRPVAGSKNQIASLTLKRAGRTITPSTQSVDADGGRFIFDFAPFAPTAPLTIEMVGKTSTRTCAVSAEVLKGLR